MTTGWMIQICVDVMMLLGVAVTWFRMNRPAQDDPRLSRGLQLLQSKIAVLEDLNDRTDAQVKQLTNLIEQKSRLLQNKIIEAEHQIRRVDSSMNKSKEVAEIFQDKIPHQEIIERQNTIKYVTAAKMANAGRSLEEIAREVDLPMGQIELIAKLNREQLVFDADALPEWAQAQISQAITDPGTDQQEATNFASEVLNTAESMETNRMALAANNELETLFAPPKEEYSSLKRLGEEFRNACIEFDRHKEPSVMVAPSISPNITMSASMAFGKNTNEIESEDPSALYEGAKKVTAKIVASAGEFLQQVEAKAKDFIETQPVKPTVRQVPPSLTTPPKPTPPSRHSPIVQAGTSEVQKVQFPRVNINQNLR